jgi:hypothetical protein
MKGKKETKVCKIGLKIDSGSLVQDSYEEYECRTTSVKEWRKEIKTKEKEVKKMKEALEFPKGSRIGPADLERVINELLVFEKYTMTPLTIFESFFPGKDDQKMRGYSHEEFMEIISRLTKLGKVAVDSFNDRGRKVRSVHAI